jgi:predicted dehydrogenase
VWARSHEAACRLAAQYGVPAEHRFEDLLARCDAVAFSVPPAAQAELATHAVRYGLAVLLERPLAADTAGAEELAMAVDARNAISQLALDWRYAAEVRRFLAEDVPRAAPTGGSGLLVTCARPGPAGAPPWQIERGALLTGGPDLLDLLDAALGAIVGVRAHGDPRGWLGVMLDHQVGRYSEASLYTAAAPGPPHAEISVFGPGGTARLAYSPAADPAAFATMYREFAASVATGVPHELDVRRGLHLQQVIEAAETDLIVGA